MAFIRGRRTSLALASGLVFALTLFAITALLFGGASIRPKPSTDTSPETFEPFEALEAFEPFELPAVIDRFVDNTYAVLLLGPEEIEMIVPRSSLPTTATPGTWLRGQRTLLPDGEVVWSFEHNHKATSEARRRVETRIHALKEKPKPAH